MHKTRKEWIYWFKKYERRAWDWSEYLETLQIKGVGHQPVERLITGAKQRFKSKYKLWKLDDNSFMKNKVETRGRKPKRDIDGFIRNLTREQLEDIARVHLEDQEEKENSEKKRQASKYKAFNVTELAFILVLHRTTLYKKPKTRAIKYEEHLQIISAAFYENKQIYGRRRLSIFIKDKHGVLLDPRTIGNYMNRLGLKCKTRKARKKREVKDTNVKYIDLVKRNYNPTHDNIVATDVSYIPAKEEQNHVYLSIAISHKTKLIESWELSKSNDLKIVVDTLSKIRSRRNLIVHSDHGFQYSNSVMKEIARQKKYKISMGEVGNSLDNREAEYFFGCLKGECLKHIPTWKMKYEQIVPIISDYINWYNTKRIQSRLQWKTPAEASAYAV